MGTRTETCYNPHGTLMNPDTAANAKSTPCVCFNKGSCAKNSHMRPKVSSINIFVPTIGLKMEKPFLMQKGTVGSIQKMSKQGHSPPRAC